MVTADDVKRAWESIAEAEQHYRDVLRAAIADGIKQAELSELLGRTREMLRQDAMSEAKRQEMRDADAKRKAELRRAAKAN